MQTFFDFIEFWICKHVVIIEFVLCKLVWIVELDSLVLLA